jgi:hypothetical protein
MPTFQGAITQADTVILPIVSGDYHDTQNGTLRGWEGWFEIPGGKAVGHGNYTLELDDGSIGRIMVNRVQQSSGSNARASFTGQGPPPC